MRGKNLKNFICKNLKGFSLLELMVVLAIMGLLAGIAVPIILTVQRDSRDAQRLKQLEAISIGAAKFYTEYGVNLDVYMGGSVPSSTVSNNPCSGAIPTTTYTNPPSGDTFIYYICAAQSPTSTRVVQVTLTNGYYLRKSSSPTSCGGSNVSKNKEIVFRIAPGSANTQGFIILCKESGGEHRLEYKQG